MLNRITTINLTLGVVIVILAFYTVIWHSENRRLHLEESQVQKQNQKIMSMHKQLLTEHSEQVSGKKIKQKSVEILWMRQPIKNDKRPRKSEWREITL